MRDWRRFLAKLGGLARRESIERDLDREVAFHLALLADEFERRGMTPDQARKAARRAFGATPGGVPFYDPAAFLGASFLLMSVAVAASVFPAQRALRVDPMVALRCQ